MAEIKDLNKNELEGVLTLKIKENNHLKAQNSRLIEHLQNQIDASSTHQVQNESIHNKITQIGGILNEIKRQEQERKLNLDRIFQKVIDLESQFALSQKQSNAPTVDDFQQLKLDVIRIHARETAIENHLQSLNNQLSNTNRAFSMLFHKLLNAEVRQTANMNPNTGAGATAHTQISEDDLFKIADEFKSELKGNDEDYQLILRLLSEKNGTPAQKHEST